MSVIRSFICQTNIQIRWLAEAHKAALTESKIASKAFIRTQNTSSFPIWTSTIASDGSIMFKCLNPWLDALEAQRLLPLQKIAWFSKIKSMNMSSQVIINIIESQKLSQSWVLLEITTTTNITSHLIKSMISFATTTLTFLSFLRLTVTLSKGVSLEQLSTLTNRPTQWIVSF